MSCSIYLSLGQGVAYNFACGNLGILHEPGRASIACLIPNRTGFRLYSCLRRTSRLQLAVFEHTTMFKRTRGTDGATALRALSRSGRPLQAWAYSTRGVGVTPNTETSPRDNHTPSPSSEHETHATGPVPGQTQAQSSLNPPPPIDIEALRGRLRDWGVLASTSVRRRADQFSKQATTSFSHLGLHLNRATGYEEIEALKRQVVEQGMALLLSTISDARPTYLTSKRLESRLRDRQPGRPKQPMMTPSSSVPYLSDR